MSLAVVFVLAILAGLLCGVVLVTVVLRHCGTTWREWWRFVSR